MDLNKAARDPWVWGQLLLLLAIALAAPLLPRFVGLGPLNPLLNRIDPEPLRWAGVAAVVVGIALAVWGLRSLGRSLTPGTEPLPSAPLVTSGAYTLVRHPIYLGIVLAAAGYTLAWSNWTLAVVLGLVALGYFDAKARAEERWLVSRYPDYRSYMLRVRRRVV